ncbi:MAG TPA: hypothetical protein VE998_02870, partial [Terriglobales bacterium]|nr:hypothetical protein [Terriglobales bacterium]
MALALQAQSSPAVPASQQAETAASLANQPPQPPQVTYQNGLLTVHAENSTLADVLAQVQAKTGAQIQVPPGAATERMVVQEGPEPARDALAALL